MSASIQVASQRDPSQSYTVRVAGEDLSVTCTCPAFRFRGTCKHVQGVASECDWQSWTGPESFGGRSCPRCDGMVAVVISRSMSREGEFHADKVEQGRRLVAAPPSSKVARPKKKKRASKKKAPTRWHHDDLDSRVPR
jgi:hypothetical protein